MTGISAPPELALTPEQVRAWIRNVPVHVDFRSACRGVVEALFQDRQEQVNRFNARFQVSTRVLVVAEDATLQRGTVAAAAFIYKAKQMAVAAVSVFTAAAPKGELYSLDRVMPE